LGLITKNKAIVNHFESLMVDKADLERRLLELSKELQRFKAKLLSNASCIEETKQVLLNTKPFELKIEEAKKGFLHLLNSFNVSSINDSMSEDEMK
jgi:gamma-glutamyl phosphate reductase